MKNGTILKFEAVWNGEPAAGIMSGSEEITISFKHGQTLDTDTIAYWRESIAQFYDGAKVTLTGFEV